MHYKYWFINTKKITQNKIFSSSCNNCTAKKNILFHGLLLIIIIFIYLFVYLYRAKAPSSKIKNKKY
ncbi:hypothetical protein BpHYR1_004030 [Brachionus plicatilis]|uniref:Uncharacterized protein n=1 Tax=Brachionus plicatilis TaxID=10195 RepID=A0A3M7T3G8_BRAPC|nr:hypothetical protein BpHYR1_004030 [Brachionus plicatilis]